MIGDDNSIKYDGQRTIIETVIREVGLSVKTENLLQYSEISTEIGRFARKHEERQLRSDPVARQ
jgi:hypothetical protein